MTDDHRQHRRVRKPIIIQFCLADAHPPKWDQSVIDNISDNGVMFIAPSDLNLKDKTVQLHIRIPELAPVLLELEALVLDAKPRLNSKFSDIRAKFINLSEENKKHLSIVEKIIDLQEIKNAQKGAWKLK